MEDLDKYSRLSFLSYGSQKYNYCQQAEVLNHYLHNKGICFPLRNELSRDISVGMLNPKTSLIRLILIADKSITIASQDEESDDESFSDNETMSEPTISVPSIAESLNESFHENSDISYNLDHPEPGVVPPDFQLRQGNIRITPYNYVLVLKVLKALKSQEVPLIVIDFLEKFSKLDQIEFAVISSSHSEKLKHLFFSRLLKYAGFAFKHASMDEQNFDTRHSTPSDRSFENIDRLMEVRSQFEYNIEQTLMTHVKDALRNPKAHVGSTGYIGGLAYTLKYLDERTTDFVVKTLRKCKFLNSENVSECFPLCISIIEKYDDKFTEDELEKLKKISLDYSKKCSSKSKKLYLGTQLLLTKLKDGNIFGYESLSKFNSKTFLKSKPLAKLFIKYFITTYYGTDSIESGKSESNANLEYLIKTLKSMQKSAVTKGKNRVHIVNYIYSEILSYEIIKQGYDSFENMNLYSLIYDIFQTNEFRANGGEVSQGDRNPHRQVNFFLELYEKSLSYLSRTSPEGIVSSLKLIFENSRNSTLFSSALKFYEYKIVDKLYYCSLISYSQNVIDVIFNELEYIAILQIEDNRPLTVISDTVRRHQNTLKMSEMNQEICFSFVGVSVKYLETFY